jgi:G3E family GTPase
MIIDIVNGFLGSGKTTFIQQMMEHLASLEKVVILVNEFGAVGVDGAILKQGGGEVVELSSGCICCTLKADLSRQIPEIVASYNPDRIIVEPSGVATIKNLLETFGSLRFETIVQGVKVICIVDAQNFMDLYGAAATFIQSQLIHSDIVLINKCDLVTEAEIEDVKKTILLINRKAVVLLTQHCRIGLEQVDAPPNSAHSDLDGGEKEICHQDSINAAQHYQSYSRLLRNAYSRDALRKFFSEMHYSAAGNILRAKGIFECGEGWVRFDFLPGQVAEDNIDGNFQNSRIMVIGYDLDHVMLDSQLSSCVETREVDA